MLKAKIFTLAALLVVLMSNVYVGRAEEEPFEIVWKKDIGKGIGSYPLDDFQNFYVASDKIGNFLVYKDGHHSLVVLDLNTGEFKNRIEIEMDNDKEIKKFRLLKNNTRLAVWGNNGWIYIFDTQTWSLEKTICAGYLHISDDMKYLITDNLEFHDFESKELLFKNDAYAHSWGPVTESVSFETIVSKNIKRVFQYSKGYFKSGDVSTLITISSIDSNKIIFQKQYDKEVFSFVDDSINKVFIQNETYNIKYDNTIDTLRFNLDFYSPPYKLSANQRYLYFYNVALSIENPHSYYNYSNFGKFADLGEDYLICWDKIQNNQLDTNYLVKLKINEPKLTPVLEISEETEILYPNPTNSVVIIPNIQLQNISELKVFDEKGSNLSKNCQINILPNGVEINMSNLLTGIYFIQINNSNSSKSFKVIKN